jgi:carbon-monoxide dehydrogenase large subunit
MANDGIGDRVLRKEDKRFITGRGRYTDDINMSGVQHAVFVRSPHAHARIKSIDVAEAKAAPGVADVLTGGDLAADKVGNIICGWMIHSKDGSPMKAGVHPALAKDTVRYVGDAVAIVIAATRDQARDAAERVMVDYEELPAVVDPANARDDGAPQIHPEAPRNTVFEWALGNQKETEAAFSRAAKVVKLDLVNNRVLPNAIEPRAALAVYDPAEEHFTLYNTSQNPHTARLVLSAFVGIAPEHKLRVIAPDVGGGFGSKIFIYPDEAVCLWASKRIGGRPVKWTADRSESFLTDAHGRDHVTHAEMAFDRDHKILGFRIHTTANVGGYLSTIGSVIPTYLYGPLLSGQYNIPAIYVEVDAVYTNTTPVDAVRGAGRPEAAFVVERIMETAARELGEDPAELRRKNFVRTFPHQTPVVLNYDIGDYQASLDKALEMAGYKNMAARKEEARKRGKLRGIGISCYFEACGLAPSRVIGSVGAGVGLWDSAEVRVNPVGTIEVLTGNHSHGQGHETTFAQVVNDRLGIGLDKIQIVHGDTDKVQFGMGTSGSRTVVGLSALVGALDKVEAKAKKIAAHLLEAAESDIVIENGELKVTGTDKKKAFSEIALAAYTAHNLPEGMEPGLKETTFYDPTNFSFPAGTHICEVEVDPKTGKVDIVQFVVADDFGTLINPMIVEGQVHGGVTHGIGQALLESAKYDPTTGQLLTGSFMDYAMPRADDVPSYKIEHTMTPSPGNPLGMKGCGEAGAIGSPPAVINAITDAIGNNDLSMPATPEKVWLALQAGARKAA